MESTPPANPYSSPAANLYGASSGPAADGVSPSTIATLSATKPWVRFMSVLMWIGVGVMLLLGAGMGVVSAIGLAKTTSTGPFGGKEIIFFAIFYGLMAFVYIFPAIKLWKYANRIGSLGSTRSVADLDAALNEQRSFWKFAGIMAIILISLYLVAVIGLVIFKVSPLMKAADDFVR
ncbi:MAG TPA: DUF5362 family protein [Prosthecobacter sp.]|nr:DUF5362 family protein [Prosthecobacter sp.]